MTPAVGPFYVACVLLAGGGALKAWRPNDTATALRAAGIPLGSVAVRVVGAGEAALGLAAVTTGAPLLAALVALSFAAFAVFVAHALARRLPLSSCGCFGSIDTPPTVLHVAINVAAAIAAVVTALDPPGSLTSVLADQPMGGVPLAILAVGAAYLAGLALTELPRARALRVARRSG